MPFQREISIPFHLVDAAGILFFSHVFTLAHQIFEIYVIEALNIPWHSWFLNQEWIVPIKHTEANYHKPLLVGLPCTISLNVLEMRTCSFKMAYHFYQNQFECCAVTTAHVFCERAEGTKRTIPPSIRALLETQT